MAFGKISQKVPTAIGNIHIVMQDPDGINSNRSIRAEVAILDQNGEIMRRWEGDLLPHLPPATVTALIKFLNDLRQQAAQELIP